MDSRNILLDTIYITFLKKHFFLQMTCSYICREWILYRKRWLSVKKMTGNNIKRVGFLLQAKKYLDIWSSRKAFKHLLHRMYLMLDLLHHKRIPLITTVAVGSIFWKIFKTWEKIVRRINHFYSSITMMKL